MKLNRMKELLKSFGAEGWAIVLPTLAIMQFNFILAFGLVILLLIASVLLTKEIEKINPWYIWIILNLIMLLTVPLYFSVFVVGWEIIMFFIYKIWGEKDEKRKLQ